MDQRLERRARRRALRGAPHAHDAPCAPIRTSSINPLIVRCWLLHELSALARVMFREPGRGSRAAVRLVLAQPSIGSQLVDNLNASSHVRAVLTDLFLLDEALKR